jgi:hypothetical protein
MVGLNTVSLSSVHSFLFRYHAEGQKVRATYKNKAGENVYPMAGDQVTPFIHDLCRMDRFGGRCVRKDSSVWEVLDINLWTEDHVIALHQRFPSISASVEANRNSLGGFCVVLQQHRASHAWIAVLVCCVMVSMVFSLARFFTIQ